VDSPTRYFAWWRTTTTRDREIVDAVVNPEHAGPSAELAAALEAWPGPYYWSHDEGPPRLTLIRARIPAGRERWWLHAVLFAVTFVTVWMGGALLAGTSLPFAFPVARPFMNAPSFMADLARELVALRGGLNFAMALMAILLAHETGHYLLARRYGINASPPYFLPAPPVLNFIGTFGAFIRLRSPIVDRRQLLDVGAAGPWAGFVVAMIALVVGLARSQVVPDLGPSGQLIHIGAATRLYLGDSPIMWAMRHLVVGEGTVVLDPVAFAGWLGLFVTMLNLLPLGQLDGGHVLYSLLGRWQSTVSGFVLMGIVALGFVARAESSTLTGVFWWVWAVVILVIGRGRIAHPQVLDRRRPLPKNRRPLGWVTLLLMIGAFSPIPVYYL
jgi:membrane-associated protease RseP (regulator of RpoE activity)